MRREEGGLFRANRVLQVLVLAAGFFYFAAYVFIASRRIAYPFPVWWAEDFSAEAVLRILSGKALYAAPSIDFVSPIYTPFFFYLGALLAKWTGPGLFPLRLLSFAASLGIFYILYQFVRKETSSRFFGMLAVLVFCATYPLSRARFDLARVDTLFIFFMLAAFYLIRFGHSAAGHAMAGILLALAFLTKQTAIISAACAAVYLSWFHRKTCLWALFAFGLSVVVASLTLNEATDGWYAFYTWRLPLQHDIVAHAFSSFWLKDLFGEVPIAFIVSVLYLLLLFFQGTAQKACFSAQLAAGFLATSYAGRLHVGGGASTLMPAYLVLALFFAQGVHWFSLRSLGAYLSVRRPAAESFVLLLCLLQFGTLVYDPRSYVPDHLDFKAGKSFVEKLSKIHGAVFAPHHNYLTYMAGKSGCAYSGWIWDVLRGKDGPVRKDLAREIKDAIREKRYAALILRPRPARTNRYDGTSFLWEVGEFDQHYMKGEPIAERYRSVLWQADFYYPRMNPGEAES